jgi:hypothetical protein
MEYVTLLSEIGVPAYGWHRRVQKKYYKKREHLEREGKDLELALVPEPSELIERLECVRLNAGMAITKFAKVIGEDMQQYYQWVKKAPPIRTETISRLQKTLARIEEDNGAV